MVHIDQTFLICPGKLLDRIFAPLRFSLIIKHFRVYKFHRPPRPCVLGTLACL